ncbi:FAD-dependent oxidoreductase [Terriglobus aquaticus]|uniref:FAD-dependent oxidoreductase n=1 Tax=Terriglobus aquaticus TaxID=940139 RepID=A0ABW9KHX7_9BACT|nr:FAD-dependent oxidoreductase [Terriglobus aquaticus]
MNTMQHPDVVIAGAGVIGLSLALELRLRGCTVLVLQREQPGLASRAAAGMLAAHDPHHPAPLQPLADLALELYPAYLDRVRAGSGHAVPIQTEQVVEADPTGEPGRNLLPTLSADAGTFVLRPEQSLDPRDLHAALRAAATQAGVLIRDVSAGTLLAAPDVPLTVDCTGAWSPGPVRPAKGQMLRVQLPPAALRLRSGNAVVRTDDIYIVPRLDGSALIGATVEDAGFDLAIHDADLTALRARAAAVLPLAADAPELERWSGLRPRTADDLPILGELAPGRVVANGLFRNGILLAPAVARVMAQLLTGKPPTIPLDAFAPERLALQDR